MDDVSGLLAQNFGIRGQGKSAPMAASKTASTQRSVPSSTSRPSYDDFLNPTSSSSSLNNNSNDFFNTSSSSVNNNRGSFTTHDPILDTFNKGPVFDTPAYDDDDIFNGIPGIRSSSSSSFKYDDMFPSDRSPPPYDDLLGSIGKGNAPEGRQSPPAYDDLLGGFGMGKKMDHGSAEIKSPNVYTGFEDLLPGFGSGTPMPQPKRETEVPKTASPPPPSAENESFFSGGSFSDPLDNLTKQPSGPVNVDASSPTHSFFSDSMPSFTFGAAATHTERSDPFGGKQSPDSSQHSETGDDIWLTVSEIPLFTKPTSAPPPYRPPPPRFFSSSPPEQDEYDSDVDDEMERSSAAMKDAMNRAELKFKHAKEVREKMAANEREEEEEEERQRRIEREREGEEQRRVVERERQAVERATREARERAANDAMMRAQRGVVHRVQQEARERAAHDSREKAAAAEREAKERVAAAEREKAAKEKAAAAVEREAKEREKAAKERERKMQRAAVEKAAAEARERAAQAAKEKHQQSQSQRPKVVPPPPAAAASAAHQQDDFDSIFGMGGSRSSSVPKKNPQEPQAQTRAPSASAATVRKTAPPAAANMMDDLSAIFGGGPSSSSGEFQEIHGETEDRRKARFEREMRTRDRATKALAEKNARDMQVQQEQAERHRIGETLDFEIKRWAAGKEGNLRSLLSSLHYILWAESGWQPVSMADLITGVSVKKVYRKATLCIHPDKVQQKGATLQQKYIAEKVFDILKEAWNKFNSEELY